MKLIALAVTARAMFHQASANRNFFGEDRIDPDRLPGKTQMAESELPARARTRAKERRKRAKAPTPAQVRTVAEAWMIIRPLRKSQKIRNEENICP